jgi:uncharacterized membrane protein
MSGVTIGTSSPIELSQDEKADAGLAHALMISTWWIGPRIIFVVKRQSRFVSFHALQALIWQIIFTVSYVFGIFLIFAMVLKTVFTMPRGAAPGPDQLPIALFITFPIFWLIVMSGMVISMTLGIVYCLRAMRGQSSGYPVIGNWARRILGE